MFKFEELREELRETFEMEEGKDWIKCNLEGEWIFSAYDCGDYCELLYYINEGKCKDYIYKDWKIEGILKDIIRKIFDV